MNKKKINDRESLGLFAFGTKLTLLGQTEIKSPQPLIIIKELPEKGFMEMDFTKQFSNKISEENLSDRKLNQSKLIHTNGCNSQLNLSMSNKLMMKPNCNEIDLKPGNTLNLNMGPEKEKMNKDQFQKLNIKDNMIISHILNDIYKIVKGRADDLLNLLTFIDFDQERLKLEWLLSEKRIYDIEKRENFRISYEDIKLNNLRIYIIEDLNDIKSLLPKIKKIVRALEKRIIKYYGPKAVTKQPFEPIEEILNLQVDKYLSKSKSLDKIFDICLKEIPLDLAFLIEIILCYSRKVFQEEILKAIKILNFTTESKYFKQYKPTIVFIDMTHKAILKGKLKLINFLQKANIENAKLIFDYTEHWRKAKDSSLILNNKKKENDF